jgi:hypothetical protein
MLLAVFIALGVLLSSASTAYADKGTSPLKAKEGASIRGDVTAIDGVTLVVRTPRGAVRVVTDEETQYWSPEGGTVSFEDIVIGDHIAAMGRQTGRAFHARLVALIDPSVQVDHVGGQVASIDGTDIVINTRSGETVTVHTGATTVFHIPGVEDPGLDDVAEGQLVGAIGVRGEDDALDAAVILVPAEADRRARLNGEVTAIEGTDITIDVRDGRPVTVATDEETSFHVPGVDDATLGDVAVGDRVTVAVEMEDGAPKALVVVVTPEDAARLGGEIAAIGASTLTLETHHGVVQVLTDGSTLFRVPGVEDASISDLQVGEPVVCGGSWIDETTFSAIGVEVHGSTAPGRPGEVAGRVVAAEGDRLTLGTARGPVTVLADEETVVRVPDVEDANLADIEIGDVAGARGVWNADGALEADAIGVRGDEAPPVRPRR